MVAGTALASVVVAPPALALSGGPDNFGYTFKDSTEVGGPVFDFQDISATGTDVGIAALCDDCVTLVPLPFTFSFYGNAQNEVFVSSNGYLSFANDDPEGGCCNMQPIPTAGPPDNFIAGFWTDLGTVDFTDGSIKSETLGTSPNRIFVVQFTDIPDISGSNVMTMQFKLFEGSNNIEVHYLSTSGEFGTVIAGIENATGTDGLQYFNVDAPTPSNIAVRYTYPAPPVDVAPPTCFISALRAGPPKQADVTVQDTGSGLASITIISVYNGTVSVAPFTPGTTGPVVVTATKTDQSKPTVFSFDATDVAGNTRRC